MSQLFHLSVYVYVSFIDEVSISNPVRVCISQYFLKWRCDSIY